MRVRIGNILWGLLFIIAGIGFAGNVMFDWNFTIFFEGWWTLFIIVPCGISIIQSGFCIGNTIGLSVGVLLYLSDRLDNNLFDELIWPAILILIGCFILLKNGVFARRDALPDKTIDFGEQVKLAAIAGARKEEFTAREFPGGELNAVFGGVTLDLRDSVVSRDVEIHCSAVFGGVEILVPDSVQVIVSATPIFGGVSNKKRNNTSAEHKLYVNAICMFGEVKIK